MRLLTAGLVLLLFTGCYLVKKDHYQYRKGDFITYQKDFVDTSGKIRFDGAYLHHSRYGWGYTRFFPDGKVIIGSCYDTTGTITALQCISNKASMVHYGYYSIRNDTLFIAQHDNFWMSAGIFMNLATLHGDTIRHRMQFHQKLMKRSLHRVPSMQHKEVLAGNGTSIFKALPLSETLKRVW